MFLGFTSPGDLAMALLEFLDDNDFENNKAPKQRNIDATGDFDRQVLCCTVLNSNIFQFSFSLHVIVHVFDFFQGIT